MDDEIIHSWRFHDVECFDSTPSAAIIILDKDLESFSSLRSQHHLSHARGEEIRKISKFIRLNESNAEALDCTTSVCF